MTKEELLKQCRYYKGEKECPFEPKEGDNKRELWYCEESWYRDMLADGEDAFRRDMGDYYGYEAGKGLLSSLPVTLLARIFNRFAQSSYTMSDAAREFKEFYGLWYGEPDGA